MKIVNAQSFPRAGFLGNPSDGYFGKTMSFAFANYCVNLTLTESARMRFVPGEVDDAMFDSPESLVRELRLYGYYGGVRMLKAVAKLFFEYCFTHDIQFPRINFTAEYRTNIPRLVGLSGSSAICSAMLKALMEFYGVEIPLDETPTICLEAEKYELGINCGFQDRVIQMYGGFVFMDFERAYVEANNKGRYEVLDPDFLRGGENGLNVYVAFDPNRAEESGRAHKKVKKLFDAQSSDVLSAMSEFADLAQQGRDAFFAKNFAKIPSLINANFDLRDKIFNVSEENRAMVMAARATGTTAKFAGSGGAIVGTFEDEKQFQNLSAALAKINCTTFVPTIGTREMEAHAPQIMTASKWRNS